MDRILSSWKEIAQYVGKGVRTVQRWEDAGLPVSRPLGESGSVTAHTQDIDAWLAGGKHDTYAHLQARLRELEAENRRLRSQLDLASNNHQPSGDSVHELLYRSQILLRNSAALRQDFVITLETCKNTMQTIRARKSNQENGSGLGCSQN